MDDDYGNLQQKLPDQLLRAMGSCTPQRLAYTSGVSVNTIKSILEGESLPRLPTLMRIATALHTSLDALCDLEGAGPPRTDISYSEALLLAAIESAPGRASNYTKLSSDLMWPRSTVARTVQVLQADGWLKVEQPRGPHSRTTIRLTKELD